MIVGIFSLWQRTGDKTVRFWSQSSISNFHFPNLFRRVESGHALLPSIYIARVRIFAYSSILLTRWICVAASLLSIKPLWKARTKHAHTQSDCHLKSQPKISLNGVKNIKLTINEMRIFSWKMNWDILCATKLSKSRKRNKTVFWYCFYIMKWNYCTASYEKIYCLVFIGYVLNYCCGKSDKSMWWIRMAHCMSHVLTPNKISLIQSKGIIKIDNNHTHEISLW